MHGGGSEAERFERMPTVVFDDSLEACRQCAGEIAELIREREREGKYAVLGLATGSTPVGVYRELIRMHREEGLSFKQVITFNLDEYYGLAADHRESYQRFMREQLFDHVDLPADQCHVPDGSVAREAVFAYCQAYEAAIEQAGGIDLQLLGIGRTGHIGFNEPGVEADAPTSLVTLDALTRRDAARDFLGEANVPRFAITMGVGTILRARRVILLAWGKGKAGVVAAAVEGPQTSALPASFLQCHAKVDFYLNRAAATELTRFKHPWLTGPVEWTPSLVRKAVVWLAGRVEKPILKLVEADYSSNGLQDLLAQVGSAYQLNIRIFNEVQHTISGWPGGKPASDDSTRPERAAPFPKRIVVLAPEPMEAVARMGGALHRLVSQGHEVHVLYQTSGNLAVPDEEAQMAAGFIREAVRLSEEQASGVQDFAQSVREAIEAKGAFGEDSPDIRRFKSIIRRGEAIAACASCGLTEDRVEFLDQLFYARGRYRQFRYEAKDVEQLCDRLNTLKPHQIYATGLLADPNSVSGFAFGVFQESLRELRDAAWMGDCRVWLYRGEDAEWEPHEIDMATPLSPDELGRKITAVYQHRSQRSQTPTLGGVHREYWQQIEAINRETAARFDALGLAEYEAIEAFRRWHGEDSE